VKVISSMSYKMEELKIELALPKPTTQAFHNDVLSRFNEILYKNIYTVSNITSKEQIYAFKDAGNKTGFRLEKSNKIKVYFLETKDVDKLPLKIMTTKKDSFRTDVLYRVKSAESVKIPSSREASFRNVVDWMCNFEHSEPIHWKLNKIIKIVAAVDRLNYREIGEAGFGKDSIVDAITELINETANIYGATFAKLEYSLKNSFLFFNEMGNLKEDDKINMQNFLLNAGAYRNKYIKRSRRTKGTQEEYDMTHTSVCIASNPYSYYRKKGQETFVDMFTQAVMDRFIPFKFDGRLTHNFTKPSSVDNVVTKNKTFYKKIISTLNWYRENNSKVEPVDWDYIPRTHFTTRFKRSFDSICKYISLYAKDREEYKMLVQELLKCHHRAILEEKEHLAEDIIEEQPEVTLEEFGK